MQSKRFSYGLIYLPSNYSFKFKRSLCGLTYWARDVTTAFIFSVVTGATDGLGKAYSEALAKKGLSIVLISRTQGKLEAVAREIGQRQHTFWETTKKIYFFFTETKHQVETKIIAVDFTAGDHIYHEIEKQLTGLEVGLLINNVGMSYPHPEYFLELKNKDEIYKNIIECNIASVTNMCKVVMPGMVERRKGVVINISSTAAAIPSPLMTVYAATKAYIDKFSNDLAAEYAKYNIVVQCLLPGYVATKMSKIRRSTWMAPSPQVFVKDALRTVGVHQTTTGYFPHTLLIGVIHTLDAISPKLSRWIIIRTMENIRARALRHSVY